MDGVGTMVAMSAALIGIFVSIVIIRAWLRTAAAAEALVAEGDRLRELMQEQLAATQAQSKLLIKIAARAGSSEEE